HQDLPFEKLVEELQPQRDLSRNPLFQVMFALQNAPMPEIALEGLTIDTLKVESNRSQFDLSLTIVENSQEAIAELEYSTDLFEAATISRMLKHFETLLEGIVANPDRCLSDLPILTASERQQLLIDWNNTFADYPQDCCIHQLFEAQVEQTPNAVAAIFDAQILTYCQLNAKANQLAQYLRSLGLKPEQLVGICVERSLEMMVGILGILKAGGAYLPLDSSYPSERLAFILEDARIGILLTQQHLIEKLPQSRVTIACLDTDWSEISQHSQENPNINVTAENLAYVIYTSGSTGTPKGVEITHQALINHSIAVAKAYQIQSSDRILQFGSISFDVSAEEIFPSWLSGATVVIRPEAILDFANLGQFLNQEKVTVVNLPTTYWHEWVSYLVDSKTELPPTIRLAIVGTEAVQLEQLLIWEKLVGNRVRWINAYGPTEATIGVTLYELTTSDRQLSCVPIGRPIANTQIYILDSHLQPVPIGVNGEIYIGGDSLARGYLNRPDITAEKFILNPFERSNSQSLKPSRLYKTGDLARYLPDGNIQFIGRIDSQVKIRGFRIELGEIEALLSQHPAVGESVVVVREDTPGDKRLVAYVVLNSETQELHNTSAISSERVPQLRNFLKERLPQHMLPSAFVVLESLPIAPSGKVDRRALPAPDLKQLQRESTFVAPSTPVEEMLAGIWAEVLGVERVGIHDNFFELGGHSLLATRVISQVRQVFEVELPLRRLFEEPTVTQLAKDIERANQAGLGLEVPPIQRISRDGKLTLSFAQQRLWFLSQLEVHNPFYNMAGALRLQGPLNQAALAQSLNEILRRHEVLRTRIRTVDEQPELVISSVTTLPLPVLDLSELPTAQQETNAKELIRAEAQQPFDLKSDLMLRVKLLRLGEQEHIALFTLHHIASDGWSIDVLVQELSVLYQAFCNGQSSPLAELPIQYVDFATWQRQWLQGEVLAVQLAYWRQHLDGAPSVLELPTDYLRPAIQTFQGATYTFALSQEQSIALKTLSQQEGSTLFMTLLAAFKTLLYRYTGSEDIVVGSPVANRNRAELEGLIGFFVNTLVLRTDLSGNPTFRELLSRIREVALGAYAHQDLPFEKLVEELQPQRNLSYNPLFQVMFVLQNTPKSEITLSGLTLSAVESDRTTAMFDLTLYMEETDSGLIGTFEYSTDLFEANTIARMAGHLQTLLSGIVTDRDRHLYELPLLPEAETNTLLREWNDTQTDYPLNLCIHELFEAQVERTPDAVAVVFEGQQLTYRELNQRANQLAHYLQQLGVKPEELVGICVERSLEMIVGLLGILKAGGAYVPLDPAYPQERLAFMLSDSQVGIVLTQQPLLESLPHHQAQVLCLDTDWETIRQKSVDNPVHCATSENLAYLIYTSGSTGLPKGVQIPHSAVVNFLTSMARQPGLTSSDIFLAITTLSFDIAALELYLPLITGARVVIASRETATDGKKLIQSLTASGATVMQATPATWRMLLAAGWQGSQELKILCGGEALPRDLAEQLLASGAAVWNLYGPTETTIWSTVYQLEATQLEKSLVPIGHPIANTTIYLLDSFGQPVPIGVPGELYIGGAGVARGYLNRPELTAQRFILHPVGGRLYQTGDLARYRSDGTLEYLGRTDDQVKLRGFRIELGEIEAVLSQHPAVVQAVVTVREDEPDNQYLTAYVVAQEPLPDLTHELRQFLTQKLPHYMIPSAFVRLETLPLTPNGKVNRRALPAPDSSNDYGQKSFVAPRNPVEETVVGIWVQVLGVESVGIYDNFFELGGHSLLATQLISRLENCFEVELPLRRLFEEPTVAGLAAAIQEALKSESGQNAPPIDRIARNGKLPLSFSQERLWLLEQLQPGSLAYTMPGALHFVGSLDVAALEQALNEIVRRHEVLRTTFGVVDGQAVQVIAPFLTMKLPVMNLEELSEVEQSQNVQQFVTRWSQQPFDLTQGPLLRWMLLQLNPQEHLLVLNIHHIVTDGWSVGVFFRELTTLY
ncbi:MAG TPA: non-ribosomal peptide synthetase, partial [Cyanobacteria bacterium UBA12227]|nr:non-ribosomal peptide synthetase [Cyanobacteria bacterium UBA12227]